MAYRIFFFAHPLFAAAVSSAPFAAAIGNLTAAANETQIHYNAGSWEPIDTYNQTLDCPGYYTHRDENGTFTDRVNWVYESKALPINISMNFTGNAVGPIFVADKDGCTVGMSIDGGAPVNFSTAGEGTNRCVGPNPWPGQNLSFSNVTDRDHTIVITADATGNTNVNCTVKLVGIEYTDPNMVADGGDDGDGAGFMSAVPPVKGLIPAGLLLAAVVSLLQ